MKKLYSLIALLLFANLIIAQELTATQSLLNVYPGKDFTIEVTVNKAGLNRLYEICARTS